MASQKTRTKDRHRRQDGRLGTWLLAAEAEAFRGYAAEMKIPATVLAWLLILREMRLSRLGDLGCHRVAVPSKGRGYITAANPGEETIGEIQAHVERFGESLNGALALLFRAELAEHWLDQAMARKQEST